MNHLRVELNDGRSVHFEQYMREQVAEDASGFQWREARVESESAWVEDADGTRRDLTREEAKALIESTGATVTEHRMYGKPGVINWDSADHDA